MKLFRYIENHVGIILAMLCSVIIVCGGMDLHDRYVEYHRDHGPVVAKLTDLQPYVTMSNGATVTTRYLLVYSDGYAKEVGPGEWAIAAVESLKAEK